MNEESFFFKLEVEKSKRGRHDSIILMRERRFIFDA